MVEWWRKGKEMHDFLRKRELSNDCGSEKKICEDYSASRIPSLLQERELPGTDAYDKVFAAAWLDHEKFVVGTKDNKLVLWNAANNRRIDISLPRRAQAQPQQKSVVNFSKNLLATGADNPDDVAVFELPSFNPVCLLSKHSDWMFAAAWLTDVLLVTGSRDTTVKLWSVDVNSPFTNQCPVIDRSVHADKVRDLKYCPISERLATLGQDALCNIWDPQLMEVVSGVSLHHKRELVCLAMEHPLIAIGSQKFISLVDLRCGHIIQDVESADEGWGVRSLSFKGNNVLTCGGGKGRLSFFDLRAEKYISLYPEKGGCTHSCGSALELSYYNTGKGALESNDLYLNHFQRDQIQHAVYAHAYDVSGTKLLAAGGPLPYGLKGCYVALW